MSYERSRSADFSAGFMSRLSSPDPRDPSYKAWHQANVADPVREQQYQGQVAAAKAHIDHARNWREQGLPDRARRSLQSAAAERRIASKMGRPGRTAP